LNIKEYIESGIIERFVMGETTDEQSREVMAYAKQYPEIQNEIEAIENTLINLAESTGHTPKESTREQLFETLFGEAQNTKVPQEVKQPVTKVVRFNNKYLVAASIALLVSVGLNILQYKKLQTSENALIALNNEKQQFASVMASQKNDYASLKEQMDKINSIHVVKVKLQALKLIPDAGAVVYYDTQSKEVLLHVSNLPETSQDKQYQLWAIVDGKPVDAGVFDATDMNKAVLKMKNSQLPSAFAVTIEKKGGSLIPSLDQMVLLGNFAS